jgi:hypothetical protein
MLLSNLSDLIEWNLWLLVHMRARDRCFRAHYLCCVDCYNRGDPVGEQCESFRDYLTEEERELEHIILRFPADPYKIPRQKPKRPRPLIKIKIIPNEDVPKEVLLSEHNLAGIRRILEMLDS